MRDLNSITCIVFASITRTPVARFFPASYSTLSTTLNGRSGLQRPTRFDPKIYPVQLAGEVREFSSSKQLDGRLVHDMYFGQVKKPSESREPWDYYNILSVIPGDQAFRPLAEGGCPLVSR